MGGSSMNMGMRGGGGGGGAVQSHKSMMLQGASRGDLDASTRSSKRTYSGVCLHFCIIYICVCLFPFLFFSLSLFCSLSFSLSFPLPMYIFTFIFTSTTTPECGLLRRTYSGGLCTYLYYIYLFMSCSLSLFPSFPLSLFMYLQIYIQRRQWHAVFQAHLP